METRNGLPVQTVNEVKQSARKLRKQFLTYEEAEIGKRLIKHTLPFHF